MDSELITVNTENVHVDLTIHRKKQVDLTVTVIPGGGATENEVDISLSIDSIQVSGSDSALEQVGDNIIQVSGSEAAMEALGDSLHLGTINLADYETATDITFTIPTYEGVTNDSGETEVVVSLSFKGLITKEFSIDQFVITGVPEGYVASVITEKITIRVRGRYELVNKLTAKDIIAKVDFSGEEPGDATIRLNIIFPGQFESLGVLGKPSVTTSLQLAVEEDE